MQQTYEFDPEKIRQMKEKAGKFSKLIPFVFLLIALIVLIASGIYTIEPDEVGVVTRFGKYIQTEQPGLHFKIPFGVDLVQKIPVKRQLKEEFGFRTIKAGVRSQYSSKNYLGESLMLTGDLSIGNIEWIVQYRIDDPVKFLFRVKDQRGTFRNICEAIMREIVGDRSINEVLTTGREQIARSVKEKVQELCNQYDLGIDVKIVVLQDVNPHDAVKDSFNEVNQALQEKENMINQAWASYNKVIPNARGEAEKLKQEAEGYALKRVNESQGDVARFAAVLKEYRKAPEITKKRLYFETMEAIVPRFGKTVIIDSSQKNLLPLLNLEQGVTK